MEEKLNDRYYIIPLHFIYSNLKQNMNKEIHVLSTQATASFRYAKYRRCNIFLNRYVHLMAQ